MLTQVQQLSFLSQYPSWRNGHHVVHDDEPKIQYDQSWGLHKTAEELRQGNSEGAEEGIAPRVDARDAVGDPDDELVSCHPHSLQCPVCNNCATTLQNTVCHRSSLSLCEAECCIGCFLSDCNPRPPTSSAI